ncbi:hypothetical protein YYC_03546 [Plasmodium yoelii 17X]|uniref:Early transcribed membrane protein n=1 Tax=Plasmodium yoelii 17X TaxID=1323249 RepID=V7PIW8_PLAYE|nr:hypothetical protein YYC_03546 [Plasmodium yoelii 17X]
MKLAKALYFVAFLLAIKVLTPGANNYVEAKPANTKKVVKGKAKGKAKDNGVTKSNKAAIISSIAASVALAIATTFGVMYYQKNGGFEKLLWGNKKDENESLPQDKKEDPTPSKDNLSTTPKRKTPSFTPISDGYKPSNSPNENSNRTPTAPYTVKLN